MTGAPVTLGRIAQRTPRATLGLTAMHATVVRHTNGRLMTRWFGSRVLVLETIGRTTGRPRSAALVYLPEGDDLVVVPANAGAARPPAWWLNLRTAGHGIAVVCGERRPVRPVEATGAERERLWRRFSAVTPVEHYRASAGRDLPVVLLRRALA